MNKKIKWIAIIVASILVAVFLYFIIKQLLREEAELSFPDSIEVQNGTKYDEATKIVKALQYNVFDFDSMSTMVIRMPSNLETIGDFSLDAYILKNPFEDKKYIIALSSKISPNKLKFILTHEMIHLYQMEKGDLIQFPVGIGYSIWKGDTIRYGEVPYEKRGYEIEAHMLDDRISRKLDKIWYKQ